MKDILLPPLSHSSSGVIAAEQQQMDGPYAFSPHVDLFMLKFKQLEAQLALVLLWLIAAFAGVSPPQCLVLWESQYEVVHGSRSRALQI